MVPIWKYITVAIPIVFGIYVIVMAARHSCKKKDIALFFCLLVSSFCAVMAEREAGKVQKEGPGTEPQADTSSVVSLPAMEEDTLEIAVEREESKKLSFDDFEREYIKNDYYSALNSTLRLGLQPGIDIGFKTDSIEVFNVDENPECVDFLDYWFYNYDIRDSLSYRYYTEAFIENLMKRDEDYIEDFIKKYQPTEDMELNPDIHLLDGCWCMVREHNGQFFYYNRPEFLSYWQIRDGYLISFSMEACPHIIKSLMAEGDDIVLEIEYGSIQKVRLSLVEPERRIYKVSEGQFDLSGRLIAPAVKAGEPCRFLTVNDAWIEWTSGELYKKYLKEWTKEWK